MTDLPDGRRAPDEVADAAVALLRAAGHEVTVVDGCCGQLARDLGAAAENLAVDDLTIALAARLPDFP